jgi:hypothetical protein
MAIKLPNLLMLFFSLFGMAQTPVEKVVNHQIQSWFSINSNFKFSEHWSLLGDFHIRQNDFIEKNNFYFVRGAIGYTPNNQVGFTSGYGHMWVTPSNPDWNTFANESRIYQQASLNFKIGDVSLLQRVRNEQRWQDKIANDVKVGSRFTNRIRYLISFNIPIFKKKTLPSLVIADEILIHFGKEVIYNTFEQNRIFIGIKQSINSKLSYDFGYMNVYQQKYSGYQYDSNHTLRLFFYYNSSLKDISHTNKHVSGEE